MSEEDRQTYSFTRKFNNKPAKHYVYSLKVAKKKGLKPVPIDENAEPGDWVISNDGFVGEVIKKDPIGKEKKRFCLTLSFARVFVPDPKEINFLEFYEKKAFCYTQPTHWREMEANRTRTQRVIKVYARLLMQQGRVNDEQLEMLGRIFRPDDEIPRAKMKILLRDKTVQNMIVEELNKLLSENGITPDSVVKNYMNIMNGAIKEDQYATAKAVNDRFAEMVGMINKHKKLPVQNPNTGDSEIFAIMERTESSVLEDADDEYLLED